jgi:phosphoglycerate dehydrogenase-like enzyme
MRIHVQTFADDPAFAITPAQWHAAAARAVEPPHAVSFGTGLADWDAARGEAELLVSHTSVLRRLGRLEAPALGLVFVNAAGMDGLAPFGWLPDGVTLLNNRGTHAAKAGEFIAMAVLMLAAKMPAMATAQREGRWQPAFGAPLSGRRATIVGTGDLGSAGARTLRLLGVAATGVRTLGQPHPDFAEVVAVADLDAVLARTEFLVLACPLTPATRNILDRRRLGLLPRGASVVNIGRGALLDGEALCDLLESGHVSGAVLDVFDPEPLPQGHRMWRTPNLVITPHVSCDDPASYNERALGILFANLRALREGAAAPNRVDLARGY